MKTKGHTYKTRKNIGFPEDFWSWKESPAKFGRHSLEIAGHPVMQDWEEEYMRVLAEIAGSKAGRVLEVGFGMGISASFLQEYDIEEHIIIEANEDVYERLLSFAAKVRRKVTPILGFWQDTVKEIPDGSVSSILFDTYPMSADEVHRNHFPFFPEAYRLLKKGGVLTYYSDEEQDFSGEHRKALQKAGFEDIQKLVCQVNPPADCEYWQSNTIVAPIIFK